MNNTAKTRLPTGWKIYIIAGMVAFFAVIAYYTYRVFEHSIISWTDVGDLVVMCILFITTLSIIKVVMRQKNQKW